MAQCIRRSEAEYIFIKYICREAHILHLTAAQGTGPLLYHLIQKFPEIEIIDQDIEGNNLLHAAVTNKSHQQEVLDLLLRIYSLEKTTKDGNMNVILNIYKMD